jgi:hypothetical protein
VDLIYEYRGYRYMIWHEYEDDNVKMFHECWREGRQIRMPDEFYNHSPYKVMTRAEFIAHCHSLEVFLQG